MAGDAMAGYAMAGEGGVSVKDTAGLYLCVQGEQEDKMSLEASIGGPPAQSCRYGPSGVPGRRTSPVGRWALTSH